jgi:hypothetical protein
LIKIYNFVLFSLCALYSLCPLDLFYCFSKISLIILSFSFSHSLALCVGNSLKLLGERIAQSDTLLRYFANHAISSFLSSRNSQWSVLLTNLFIFFNDTSQQVSLPFLSAALKASSDVFQP